MVKRLDQSALIGGDLSGRAVNGFFHARGIVGGIRPPLGSKLFRRAIRLTTGTVRAHIRSAAPARRASAGWEAAQGKRACGHRLRLERFFFKRSGHFGCHHAAKVFFKAHGKHAVVFIVIYGDDGRDIFRQSSRNPRFLACDGTPAQQQHEQAEGKRSEPERQQPDRRGKA